MTSREFDLAFAAWLDRVRVEANRLVGDILHVPVDTAQTSAAPTVAASYVDCFFPQSTEATAIDPSSQPRVAEPEPAQMPHDSAPVRTSRVGEVVAESYSAMFLRWKPDEEELLGESCEAMEIGDEQ